MLALRLAVGGTFVFSGLAKAIDIWGVGYKIDDYLAAFGWSWAMPFAGMMAVALPLFEFLAGLMLVIGSFRRATVISRRGGRAGRRPRAAPRPGPRDPARLPALQRKL